VVLTASREGKGRTENQKRRQKRVDLKKEKESEALHYVFPSLQVTVVLTASREGKGRRKQGRSAHFWALSAAAREPTRGGDAPPLFRWCRRPSL